MADPQSTKRLPGETLANVGLVLTALGMTWMPVGVVTSRWGYFPAWVRDYSFYGTMLAMAGLVILAAGVWRLFR